MKYECEQIYFSHMKTKKNTLEVDKSKLIGIHKIFFKKHKILVGFTILGFRLLYR